MFTRVTRFSFTGNEAEQTGAKLYGQAKPLWSGQPGFHRMTRYRITEGPNANQQMVVVRYDSKENMEKALKAISQQREKIMKQLEEAGVKAEEVMVLEEIT